MTPGVDQLTARPKTIEIGGRTLQVSPLTVDNLGDLQAWIYEQLPDPAAAARRFSEGLSSSVQVEMGTAAIREDRVARLAHRLGTPGAGEMTQTLLGIVEVLYLSTRGHHPDVGRDELCGLVMAAQGDGVERATAQAFGVDPADDAGPSGPKAGRAVRRPAR